MVSLKYNKILKFLFNHQVKLHWEFPGGLVVRTCAFTAVAGVQTLDEELRSHKLCGAANKTKNPHYIMFMKFLM